MPNKIQVLWIEMLKEAERERKKDKDIIVCKDRRIIFKETFEHLYKKIMETNMTGEVVFLDRHKVAAIIICAVIKTKVMEYKVSDDNHVFLGNYYLALSAGLSYLQYELNLVLREQRKPLVDKISFPNVIHGKLDYKENLISMLYFSDKEGNLNVLALANIIFLLEQFNLL